MPEPETDYSPTVEHVVRDHGDRVVFITPKGKQREMVTVNQRVSLRDFKLEPPTIRWSACGEVDLETLIAFHAALGAAIDETREILAHGEKNETDPEA